MSGMDPKTGNGGVELENECFDNHLCDEVCGEHRVCFGKAEGSWMVHCEVSFRAHLVSMMGKSA